MDVTIEKVGHKTKIRTATAHPTWVSRTRREPILPEGLTCTSTRPISWKILSRVAKYRDKLDEENQGESGHGLPRNEGTCPLGLASEWKGMSMEGNVDGSRLGS